MADQNAVETLKAQWLADPCWDIEETGGFEEHHAELLSFRLDMQVIWRERDVQRIRTKAAELGTDNMKLAAYVLRLEERISKLEEKL